MRHSIGIQISVLHHQDNLFSFLNCNSINNNCIVPMHSGFPSELVIGVRTLPYEHSLQAGSGLEHASHPVISGHSKSYNMKELSIMSHIQNGKAGILFSRMDYNLFQYQFNSLTSFDGNDQPNGKQGHYLEPT